MNVGAGLEDRAQTWNGALPAAALLAAGMAIAAALGALPFAWLVLAKPLTTALVVVHALRAPPSIERRWIVAGLLLSLAGDIALLWPERGFLPGLIAFLLAHLAYLVAFTRRLRLASRAGPFLIYALAASGILAVLWPDVPAGLRVPVVVYVVALTAMAAQAAVAGMRTRLVLLAGGALFFLSDALLATARFHGALPLAPLWILATYWAAQWCIATWAGVIARAYIPLNRPE
jgi:uncharacterized membrane protein YhhN